MHVCACVSVCVCVCACVRECVCVCVRVHSQASIKTTRDDHNSARRRWRGSCYRRRTVLQLHVHANDLHMVGCSQTLYVYILSYF